MIASIGDQEVTSERYLIGTGNRRRQVAESWAEDPRLTKGTRVQVSDVVKELDRIEGRARETSDSIEDQNEDHANRSERAAYADNDSVAELAWNFEIGKPDFIIFDRRAGTVRRAESIETLAGRIVIPAIWDEVVTPGSTTRSAVPGLVLLPSECDQRGEDEAALRNAIVAFLDRYVELPGEAVSIVCEYVLLSWVYDRFDELPYLAFRTVDAGRGKSRAIETAGALCYRGMFCGGGSSAAATLRVVDIFGGTLIADEYDQRQDTELAADLTRMLNQGFQRNRPLLKCTGDENTPQAFSCFGPKLFALRKGFGDDATESRIISIRMKGRTRSDIPLNLPRTQFDTEALALRNRLLAWRFANFEQIAIDPSLADARLEDRANQITLPLLAIARSPDARARIVAALLDQQRDIAADRADTIVGEVVEVVFETVAAEGITRPGEPAREVNQRRATAEGIEVDKLRKQITPHKVGHILKADLELLRDRDREGTFYRLTVERATELAQRFGVPPEKLPQLSHCHGMPESEHENRLFGIENAVPSEVSACGNPQSEPSVATELPPSQNAVFHGARADCDICGNCGNFPGVPGQGSEDDDPGDRGERQAIMATEAADEAAAGLEASRGELQDRPT